MKVVKRDGKIVNFDRSRIEDAVNKASVDSMEDIPKELIDKIIARIDDGDTVEHIQDIVVRTLQNSKYKKTAELYIKYRHERELDRKGFNNLDKRFMDIITKGDDENANKPSHLLNVKRDLIAGEYFRYRTLKNLPKHLLEAHINKTCHFHDTDFFGDVKTTNCCVFNLEDMLKNGTRINNADIEEPNSISVACTVATQIIANISFQQYGGISVANFNEIMSYYAKKDFVREFKYICDILNIPHPEIIDSSEDYSDTKYSVVSDKTKEKIKKIIEDACQTTEYQLNSISSSSQTPFSTLSFNIPTSWESEQIVLKYFKVRRDGLGSKKEKRIAIFPKLSLFVVDGYNLKEGDPYFNITEDASKTIAKCFYPDILHVSKEDYNKGRYYSRMGCRSKVNQDFMVDGKYVQQGRLNFGVHTLNLGQVALKTIKENGGVDDFFRNLENASSIVKEMIEFRFNHLKDMRAKDAPILYMYGAISRLNPEDKLEDIFRSDRASVSFGYMGIDDATRLITGKTIAEESGREFGLKVMKWLYDKSVEYKHELNLPVSLYPSPIESLIYSAFQSDLKNYGDVMPEWLKSRGYYTNSYHYSSELPIDAFDKLRIESEYVKYNNGANINYSEIGLVKNNPKTIIELIQYGHELGIEYQGFNVRNDKCFLCGHEGEMIYNLEDKIYECPSCSNKEQSKMSVISRLCGYLGNLEERKSSVGRMAEIKNRSIHI